MQSHFWSPEQTAFASWQGDPTIPHVRALQAIGGHNPYFEIQTLYGLSSFQVQITSQLHIHNSVFLTTFQDNSVYVTKRMPIIDDQKSEAQESNMSEST
jgi:hypothetical protein